MFSYAAKLSWLCAMTLAFWFLMKDQTNADNAVAAMFFMMELGLLTVYLTYRAIRRFARWVMWKATYDIQYWNGPTITFDGHDKKFVPIIGYAGCFSRSQREKYWATFSEEDRKLYEPTYTKEVDEWNREHNSIGYDSGFVEESRPTSHRNKPNKFTIYKRTTGGWEYAYSSGLDSAQFAISMAKNQVSSGSNRGCFFRVTDSNGVTIWTGQA